MDTRYRIFLISYIYLIGMAVLRLIPFVFADSQTWGFNHLIFLPVGFTYSFFALIIAALIFPFLRSTENWGTALAERFSNSFISGRSKYLYRLVFIFIMSVLFAVFAAPTHFLGDGYEVIKNLASESDVVHKWIETGAVKLFRTGRMLLGSPDEQTATLTFRVVSVISGSVSIWFIFLIAGTATEHKLKRFLIFLTLLFSGAMLLFFGYTEYYPVLWIFFSGHIYFSLKYLKTGRGLSPAWLFLVIGLMIHFQLAVLVPGALFISFSKGRGLSIFRRYRKIILSLLGLATVTVVAALLYLTATDLYIEDIFLPPFFGKPIDPGYAIFSLTHLLDIFNMLILISPLLLLFLLIGREKTKKVTTDKTILYLLIIAGGSLLFLFVIDPKLTMPRDWDLFSLSFYALSLASILACSDRAVSSLKNLSFSMILFLIIWPLPYLLTNLNTAYSINYAESLTSPDNEKTLSLGVILQYFYVDRQDQRKIDSVIAVYNTGYARHRQIQAAFKAIDRGDIKSADSIARTIIPNRFDGDYDRLLSLLSYFNRRFDEALHHIGNAIQLRKYASEYYGDRARIYFAMKEQDSALQSLRDGFRCDQDNIKILEAMAQTYDIRKQYDSSRFYAQRILVLDSTRPYTYYWLTKAYAARHEMNKATEYFRIFAGLESKDSTLTADLRDLEDFLANSVP